MIHEVEYPKWLAKWWQYKDNNMTAGHKVLTWWSTWQLDMNSRNMTDHVKYIITYESQTTTKSHILLLLGLISVQVSYFNRTWLGLVLKSPQGDNIAYPKHDRHPWFNMMWSKKDMTWPRRINIEKIVKKRLLVATSPKKFIKVSLMT